MTQLARQAVVKGADMGETAVVVPVPELEPLVGQHRRRLDRAAAWGVPAHVTVIYPFAPPPITPDTVTRLANAVSEVSAFDCVFTRVEWFGEDVAWVAPEPDEHFRALTAGVWRAFPDHPPYGGQFADVVPHLTIGARADGLRAAAAEVAPLLPVTARIEKAWLMAGSDTPGGWQPVVELPLSAGGL